MPAELRCCCRRTSTRAAVRRLWPIRPAARGWAAQTRSAELVPFRDNRLTITGAGNSFTGRSGPLSPGEFATITLGGVQPDQPINLGLNAPLPTSLEGVQVLFDGELAAIVAVGSGVVVCLTPYDLVGKISTVV